MRTDNRELTNGNTIVKAAHPVSFIDIAALVVVELRESGCSQQADCQQV